MPKYIYNGIELPALPEWDKTTYPYAAIIYNKSISGIAIPSHTYCLVCTTEPCVVSSSNTPNFKDYSRVMFTVSETAPESGDWKFEAYTTTNTRFVLLTEVWSNYDMLNADGSIYLAASDPVPVGGEPEQPETPTLTARDLYRKINGELVKHTLYKKVGGELVKVDEYSA